MNDVNTVILFFKRVIFRDIPIYKLNQVPGNVRSNNKINNQSRPMDFATAQGINQFAYTCHRVTPGRNHFTCILCHLPGGGRGTWRGDVTGVQTRRRFASITPYFPCESSLLA